jgi:diphthine methyl ester acylhydrolase
MLRMNACYDVIAEAHIFEHQDLAWCVALLPSKSLVPHKVVAFTGGDDSVLTHSLFDAEPPGLTPLLEPVKISGHDAGVTAILPLPIQDGGGGVARQLLLTGSYDEGLRVYWSQGPYLFDENDQPLEYGEIHPRLTMFLKKLDMGGGVWRLKLISFSRKPFMARVLASCMHAGPRIIDIEGSMEYGEPDSDLKMTIAASFDEHKSMNYASDFLVPSPGVRGHLVCLSTSFYDRKLCVWEFCGEWQPDSETDNFGRLYT